MNETSENNSKSNQLDFVWKKRLSFLDLTKVWESPLAPFLL